ncbi:MAG: hypothetical protein CMN28_06390 [Salinisphaeraceae bacterium]|nr:hypothetical protein [Salinisphaeraceae bacterium]
MAEVQTEIPALEALFEPWQAVIGEDYAGYRNHVYRMVHFCLALRDCDEQEREKVFIAGVFHDLGIWTERSIDYIDPSVRLAQDYCARAGLEAWSDEIGLMISEHHKLRAYRDARYPLVEVFRRGDLVDFSLGLFKFDVSKVYFAQVTAALPNAGFHKGLVKKASRWFVRHPLNPAPMMKW